MSSTSDTRRTSVGDVIGCVSSARQCLTEVSSRRRMGLPVPKLILRNVWSVDQSKSNSENPLVIKPIEAQPDPGGDHWIDVSFEQTTHEVENT